MKIPEEEELGPLLFNEGFVTGPFPNYASIPYSAFQEGEFLQRVEYDGNTLICYARNGETIEYTKVSDESWAQRIIFARAILEAPDI